MTIQTMYFVETIGWYPLILEFTVYGLLLSILLAYCSQLPSCYVLRDELNTSESAMIHGQSGHAKKKLVKCRSLLPPFCFRPQRRHLRLLACFLGGPFCKGSCRNFYAIVPKKSPHRCCNIAPSCGSSQAWQGAEKHQFSYRHGVRTDSGSVQKPGWLFYII